MGGTPTVDGIPEVYLAGFESTLDLIYPLVVKRHPSGARLAFEGARLRAVPELRF